MHLKGSLCLHNKRQYQRSGLLLKYVSPAKKKNKHWGLCSTMKWMLRHRGRSKAHRHVGVRMARRETVRQSEGIADRLDGKVRWKRENYIVISLKSVRLQSGGEIRAWKASLPPSSRVCAALTQRKPSEKLSLTNVIHLKIKTTTVIAPSFSLRQFINTCQPISSQTWDVCWPRFQWMWKLVLSSCNPNLICSCWPGWPSHRISTTMPLMDSEARRPALFQHPLWNVEQDGAS